MVQAGYWVQLRFPGSFRWTTVARAESRREAAAYAGAAFRYATDADGHEAAEARIRPVTSVAAQVDEAVRRTIDTRKATAETEQRRRR